MKVTIKYNAPIRNFRAIEKTETFFAEKMWEVPGTSLIYFQNGFQIKAVAKDEIVKINKEVIY